MKMLTRTMPFVKDALWLLDVFKEEKNLFFLDSGLSRGQDGQCSYLGFAPFKIITAKDFKSLRAQLKPYGCIKSRASFPCGAVGHMSYDGGMRFGLYAGVICMDHFKKTLTISAIQNEKGRWSIEYVLSKIRSYQSLKPASSAFKQKILIKSNMTEGQYVTAVKRALKHIHEGDIYQINLSHRMEAVLKTKTAPVDIYKQLRQLSPSDFSAYLDDGEQVILSSSPERFLKLSKGMAQVKPMKGTRSRGSSIGQDRRNKQELMDSAKEKAELLMVTDLERNDLGRVCQYGSVKVKAMRMIEEYATVFQATSTIEGKLRKDCDQFDLLESTFPSGSVTGCPKIEAMKIIKKLERSGRDLYTGALGYISFSGDMDFNVLIRTLFVKKNKISFHVGGGIVADSNPKKEYEETLLKAKAMIHALERMS